MKKSILKVKLISIGLFVLLFSCKKKEAITPSSGTSTGGTVVTSSGIYGNLQTSYYTYDYGLGNIVQDSLCVASFYASPFTGLSVPTNIYAGIVSLNGVSVSYSSAQNIYLDQSHSINLHSLSWSASGSGTVTPFTYSLTPVYPNSNSISLPDTCTKASGIMVSLTGIINSNGATSVSVIQGTSLSKIKTFSGASGTVNFSNTDLAAFSVNTPITIMVSFNRVTVAAVGSVSYNIAATRSYVKFSYLK